MSKNAEKVTLGSGNVFADLGLKDADELLVKAGLVHRITKIIKQRKLRQVDTAELLGIDQPKVSKLLNGDLYGFSTLQIMHFLNALGQDVEIVVREPKRRKARGKLTVQAT